MELKNIKIKSKKLIKDITNARLGLYDNRYWRMEIEKINNQSK